MSMTTELAQRMKAAALKAKLAAEAQVMHFDERISAFNEFQLTVCPANVVNLVEAMEAAQQELKNWRTSFDNERFRADKLAEAFKTEHEQLVMANRALITQHVRANDAEKRNAELDNDCWTYENTVKGLLERAGSAESACAEAARILKSGERMALTRAVNILLTGVAVEGEPQPCPRCGVKSMRPNGEHYCHVKTGEVD